MSSLNNITETARKQANKQQPWYGSAEDSVQCWTGEITINKSGGDTGRGGEGKSRETIPMVSMGTHQCVPYSATVAAWSDATVCVVGPLCLLS